MNEFTIEGKRRDKERTGEMDWVHSHAQPPSFKATRAVSGGAKLKSLRSELEDTFSWTAGFGWLTA